MSDDDPDDSVELSRDKALVGLGAIGAAGAAAGVGTTAVFSDEEQLANSSLTAGTLNLSVAVSVVEASDYFAGSKNGPNIVGSIGTADGDVETGLQISDLKPGDWAILRFEITVEDNPGYVEIATENFAQYENGQTDPEAAVDDSAGGNLGHPFDGQGRGELQNALRVELYDEYMPTNDSTPPRSYLSGQSEGVGGTARDVFTRLASGVVLGGRGEPIEVGPDNSPVTRYLLLELPETVDNEVQSDSIIFDIVFGVEQSRHNEIEGAATRAVETRELARGGSTTVTLSLDLQRAASLDVLERFDTDLGTATLEGVTVDGKRVAPTVTEFDTGGGAVLFDEIGPGSVSITYTLQVADGAATGTYPFTPNEVDVGGTARPVEGTTKIDVTR
ncbi:MAG: hypothetical protein ABEJ73_10455 [Haloplanus sp.]